MENHNAGRLGRCSHGVDLAPISERQLALLWERRAARSETLRTDKGARVRVLYPGRPGVTAGPDFRDALLLVEGCGMVQGDVEVHLRQRDWVGHGHQRDPNYNGVALHVTLQPDRVPAVTSSGNIPPVVDLKSLVDDENALPADGGADDVREQLWFVLSQHGYRRPESREQMAALLNRAGDERFLSRSSLLGSWLEAQPGEQTLWEAICEALGYRHNQHAMLQLAIASPIGVLGAAARSLPVHEREGALTEGLLSMTGFPSDEPGTHRWVPMAGMGTPLEADQWRLFRVRPANHPKRRIRGAAALIARYCETGLSAGLYRVAVRGSPGLLVEALSVSSILDEPTAPIGPGRAGDIAVNSVLPYLHAWRMASGDATGAQAMLGLYRTTGALAENEITRQMTKALQQPGWRRIARSARQQQGLIHLQRLLSGASTRSIHGEAT